MYSDNVKGHFVVVYILGTLKQWQCPLQFLELIPRSQPLLEDTFLLRFLISFFLENV